MKLLKTKNKIKVAKQFPGLVNCEWEHNVSSSSASLDYLGPQIPPEVWHKMMTFFRWTYDTTHSESQARLYVNTQLKLWDVWAYPQEARSGMTAREIDNPQAREQRGRFNDGWLYFGTVHHHCSMTAFQSGTDEYNEQAQDGLHITIGNIDKKLHDMHCRFYLQGFAFDPDMSDFWCIGSELMDLLPYDLWDRVARHQMCNVVDTPFPEQWKANLIEIKMAITPRFESSELGFSGAIGHGSSGGRKNKKHGAVGNFPYNLTWNKRIELAVEQTIQDCVERGVQPDKILESLKFLESDWAVDVILQACEDYKVEVEDILREFPLDQEIAAWQIENGMKKPAQLTQGDTPGNNSESQPLGEGWGGTMD